MKTSEYERVPDQIVGKASDGDEPQVARVVVLIGGQGAGVYLTRNDRLLAASTRSCLQRSTQF